MNAKLQAEQQKTTRLKTDCSTVVEQLKLVEGRITKDSSFIGFFKGQLNGMDARVEETALITVADFRKSIECKSKLKQMFMSGSKTF